MTSLRYGLAALVIALFALLAQTATSQIAGTQAMPPMDVQRPTPEIGVIHFRGGTLEQSKTQPGQWFEKRRDGTINYEFFETGATPQSLIMTGPNGQVFLSVDLGGEIIQGKWPGQPKFKTIYTITKVEPMVVAPPPSIPPVTPQPHTDGSAPSPEALQLATYKGGQFLRASEGRWEQSTQQGEVFILRQVGLSNRQVYLYDDRRQILFALEPGTRRSLFAVNGGPLQTYEALTSVSANAQSPVPPQGEGYLSEAERNTCLKTGGIVERAGLLGAERCTRPYSDGGMVCSDSSQCQGKCRTTVGIEVGTPVTGICQPSDNPFGCFAEVNNGRAGPGLCVD